MYPAYNKVVELQGEQGAVRSTHYALEAEKIHAVMYKEAKGKADAGTDVEIGNAYICPICGYTVEGDALDKCPVCGAPREMLKEF